MTSFDLIICSRVLQHVFDWRESVAEFARILKPGGDLVLLTYNRLSIYGLKKYYQHKFQNPTKGRFQNPAGLSKELKKNGLVIDYFVGALMGQPDLFSKDLSDSSRSFINKLEKLSAVSPVKYLGSRLVIRASKPSMNSDNHEQYSARRSLRPVSNHQAGNRRRYSKHHHEQRVCRRRGGAQFRERLRRLLRSEGVRGRRQRH